MNGRHRAGRAVAARRGDLGMSQQQLADKAGVDAKTAGALERGRTWPTSVTRSRIERALDWPLGELERIATLPGNEEVDPELVRMIDRLTDRSAADRRYALRRLQDSLSARDAPRAGGEPEARPPRAASYP